MWEGQWVPIVFFFLFLLPPVSVGFFKGWRTALFTTVVTFALTGIFVGIGLATYDKFIWPTFKSFFVKSVVDSHMAINSLKELSKPTAITIVIGILVLPIYGITFLIYWPLRGWLENHLWPKTSDVDQNTKTYSYRRNLKSRLSGLSISLTSSLLMASMATTASAAFFSRSDSKHKSLSSFTGALTSMYTFGQGGYDDSFFELREFLDEDFKNTQMEQFKNLMYIPQSGVVNAAEINKLDVQPFKNKLVHLLQNARTSEALANLVIDSAHFSPITLLDGVYNGSTAVDFRDTITNQNIESIIAGIHLNLHISADVKAKMEHVIETKVIASFDKTSYVRELADVQKAMQLIRREISTRQRASTKVRQDVDKRANKIVELQNTIKTLEDRIAALGDNTTGLIGAQTTKHDIAHTDTVNKENDYNTYHPQYTNALNVLEGAKNDLEIVDTKIKHKNEEIQRKNQDIEQVTRNINNATQDIKNATTSKAAKNNELQGLQRINANLNARINAAEAATPRDAPLISRLRTDEAVNAHAIDLAKTAISEFDALIIKLNNDKTSLLGSKSLKEADLVKLKQELATLQTERTASLNRVKVAQDTFDPKALENNKLNFEWKEAAKVEANENDKLNALKKEKTDKQAALVKAKDDLVTERQNIMTEINEWNVLNNKNSITTPTDVFVSGTDNAGAPLVGSIKEKEVELQTKKDDPAHGETFLIKQKNDKYKEWLEIKGKYLQLIDKLLSV